MAGWRVHVALPLIALVVTNLFIACLFIAIPSFAAAGKNPAYAGSVSCRECHEKFYQLWSTSRHGLAMQPYSDAFAKTELTPQEKDIVINKNKYRADLNYGVVIEKGPKGTKKYKIKHLLGGKNVYYFLTLLEKGRLQTLPVAYDVNKKEWLDTAASGVRHIPGEAAGPPGQLEGLALYF